MSAPTKICTKCGERKPLSLFSIRKSRSKSATGTVLTNSWCKACCSAATIERNKTAGRKHSWSALAVPHEQRTPEQREAIRAMKERYRRKKGSRPRDEIKQESLARQEQRKREIEERKKDRQAARRWPEGISDAEKFALRYRTDEAFREKQKARTVAAKKKVPLWYANQMLGGSSAVRYPTSMLEAKQVQLRIRHLLKEQGHEEH